MEQSPKIRERLFWSLIAGILGIAIATFGLMPSTALAEDTDSASDLQSGVIYTQADSPYPAAYNANIADISKLTNVTPVRLQNPWGSCWAFATTAAIESSLLNTKQVTDSSKPFISPKHLAYFAFTMHGQGNQSEEGMDMNKGANVYDAGGLPSTAIGTMAAGWGPASESDFPYWGKNKLIEYAKDASGNIDKNKPLNYSSEDDWTLDKADATKGAGYQLLRAYAVGSTATFSNPQDKKNSEYSLNTTAVDQTKDLVMRFGGASVSYLSDHSSVSQDEADDLNEFNKVYAEANHGVEIVGWNDTYSKNNFTEKGTPEGDGAWLCKNSWGSNLLGFPDYNDQAGFNGYFWLSYYDRTINYITAYELTAASDPENGTTFIDQYDYLGRRSDMEDLSNNYNGQVWFANMFTAQQDQTVTHVSLELYKNNTTSEIEVYKLYDNAKNPVDGVLVNSQAVNTPIAGYYKVKLDKPLALKKGERYSIVETVKASDNTYDIPAEAALTNSTKTYTQHTVINAGESWVYINEDKGWVDFKDVKGDLEKDVSKGKDKWELGNVMVKGYATAYDEKYAVNSETRVMYRLYNPYSGEHHYTANAEERDSLVQSGWKYENEAWIAPAKSEVPVYRLYNKYEPLGDHHYTTSKEEYDNLVKEGWEGEEVGWYSASKDDIGLYRLYNPNAYSTGKSGAHHYTADKAEHDNLVSLGWSDEGTAWYGVRRQ